VFAMLELLAKNWAWVLVRGIFTLIFGALAVFLPLGTANAVVILFGAFAIVDGVIAIAMAKRRSYGREVLLVIGILGVVAGLITLFWPEITALILLYIIAFWAMVTGLGYIVKGFGVSRDAGGRWLFVLAGLAALILGIWLLVDPREGALALIVTIGFFAIIWGFLTIFTSIRLRRLAMELDERRDFTDI
jgi:uncharacterized membrane protein HdeD (DUF308 family)